MQTRNRNSSKVDAIIARSAGRGLIGIVLASAFLASALDASVAVAIPLEQANDVAAPWIPDVIQAAVPYEPLYLGLDHFAGPNGADEVGGLTAQLSNGDSVVAGLVPNFGVTATCNDGTHLCNIGLIRRNPAGQIVTWSDPGAYGFQGNRYVIYPNVQNPAYQYIRDIKVKNGIIYVLVDDQTEASGFGRHDVHIVQFFENGRPRVAGVVLGFGFGNDSEDFYGAQMVFLSNNHMIVTATDYDGTSSYLAVNRLNVSTDGDLGQDPTWGESYVGGPNRLIRYPADVPYTINYAVNQVGFPTQEDFYVAGSFRPQGDYNLIVRKISGLTGALKPEFGGNGNVEVDFDQPNSSDDDYAAGLYVYQNDVYVGAQVAQHCHPGIGMAKYDGRTGELIPAFGGTGKIVFGGEGDAQFCLGIHDDDVPLAMSATGGRIGIVGYHNFDSGIGGVGRVDPMLAVVDAVNGGVLDLASHPVVRADGSRLGDAVLYSVYGGPSPDSPFTVAGNGRDASAGNTLSYLAGKFVLDDDIFANGFEMQ